jgi:hypothetical protein
LVALGDVDAALAEADLSKSLLEAVPGLLPLAVAAIANALLALGRIQEACEQSEHAAALLETKGCPEDTEALVHVTWAQANLRAGNEDKAREIVAAAQTALHERADALEDDAVRNSFLTRVPAHAQTIALAKQLGIV